MIVFYSTARDAIAGLTAVIGRWRMLDRNFIALRGLLFAVFHQDRETWSAFLKRTGDIRSELMKARTANASALRELPAVMFMAEAADQHFAMALRQLDNYIRWRIRILGGRGRSTLEGAALARYKETRVEVLRYQRRLERLESVFRRHEMLLANLEQDQRSFSADNRNNQHLIAMAELYRYERKVHRIIHSPAAFLTWDAWRDPGDWDSNIAELELIEHSLRMLLDVFSSGEGLTDRVYEGRTKAITALIAQTQQLKRICTWEMDKLEGKRRLGFRAAEGELRTYLAMRKQTDKLFHQLGLSTYALRRGLGV